MNLAEKTMVGSGLAATTTAPMIESVSLLDYRFIEFVIGSQPIYINVGTLIPILGVVYLLYKIRAERAIYKRNKNG